MSTQVFYRVKIIRCEFGDYGAPEWREELSGREFGSYSDAMLETARMMEAPSVRFSYPVRCVVEIEG